MDEFMNEENEMGKIIASGLDNRHKGSWAPKPVSPTSPVWVSGPIWERPTSLESENEALRLEIENLKQENEICKRNSR